MEWLGQKFESAARMDSVYKIASSAVDISSVCELKATHYRQPGPLPSRVDKVLDVRLA